MANDQPLAPGDWEFVLGRETPPLVYIAVQCRRTGDLVRAAVQEGSLDSGNREDYGLPPESEVPLKNIWYLHHLSPRENRKAIGGTTTLLRHLLDLADDCSAWVATCVIPIRNSQEETIFFLKKHGDFQSSPNPDYIHLMARKPHPKGL